MKPRQDSCNILIPVGIVARFGGRSRWTESNPHPAFEGAAQNSPRRLFVKATRFPESPSRERLIVSHVETLVPPRLLSVLAR